MKAIYLESQETMKAARPTEPHKAILNSTDMKATNDLDTDVHLRGGTVFKRAIRSHIIIRSYEHCLARVIRYHGIRDWVLSPPSLLVAL